MKTLIKSLLGAAIIVAAPVFGSNAAIAQVSNVATANPTIAIARTKAFSTGYSQIGTQYKSFLDQVATRQQTLNNLRAQLDTDGNKQLTQAELDAAVNSNNPVIKSIQTEETEIAKLQAPALKAQMFVIESIFKEYGNAQQQVVSDKKIGAILSPESFLYIQPSADVTTAITTVLDSRVPSVAITPPADWNPNRNIVALHQQLSLIHI